MAAVHLELPVVIVVRSAVKLHPSADPAAVVVVSTAVLLLKPDPSFALVFAASASPVAVVTRRLQHGQTDESEPS